jgi:hypothetical protein
LLHSPDIEHPASATNNPRIDNIAKRRIATSPNAERRPALRIVGPSRAARPEILQRPPPG